VKDGPILQGLDPRRSIGRRCELSDDSFDLTLGPEADASEKVGMIFWCEMGTDEQDAGQMNRGFGQHGQKPRELARQSRSATAALGLVFRHAQFVDAIRIQRRASTLAMDAARFDLCEVREQFG